MQLAMAELAAADARGAFVAVVSDADASTLLLTVVGFAEFSGVVGLWLTLLLGLALALLLSDVSGDAEVDVGAALVGMSAGRVGVDVAVSVIVTVTVGVARACVVGAALRAYPTGAASIDVPLDAEAFGVVGITLGRAAGLWPCGAAGAAGTLSVSTSVCFISAPASTNTRAAVAPVSTLIAPQLLSARRASIALWTAARKLADVLTIDRHVLPVSVCRPAVCRRGACRDTPPNAIAAAAGGMYGASGTSQRSCCCLCTYSCGGFCFEPRKKKSI